MWLLHWSPKWKNDLKRFENGNYLKITHNQNSQSNSNIVISKHGHLSLNIHPAKRFESVTAASLLNTKHQSFTTRLPTIHRVIFSCFIQGAVNPKDGVVFTLLVWVFQLLDFTLIGHKRVRHRAVHEEHERLSCTVNEGAQSSHNHQHLVFPGGKPVLQ